MQSQLHPFQLQAVTLQSNVEMLMGVITYANYVVITLQINFMNLIKLLNVLSTTLVIRPLLVLQYEPWIKEKRKE